VVDRTVDDRGQTDPTVAGASEGDQVGLSCQLALGHVVVDHLPHDQGSVLISPAKHEKFFVVRQLCRGKGTAVVRWTERLKLEPAPADLHVAAVDSSGHRRYLLESSANILVVRILCWVPPVLIPVHSRGSFFYEPN